MLSIALLSFIFNNSFAQTPEWTQFCQMHKTLLHEDIAPDTAFILYCKMDSIYNGIPFFGTTYNFLECAIQCNQQAKMKELAFRLVYWKCWDNNFFNAASMSALKVTDYWPTLDSLSQLYGNRQKYQSYKNHLNELAMKDQSCRKSLRGEHTAEEMDLIWKEIHFTDSLNLAKLNELINLYGFPTWENVGESYSFFAWLIAQHADPDYLHWYVHQYATAVRNGNANRKSLAYMIDRDLMNGHLPQLYGTQTTTIYFDDNHKESGLWPIEDIKHLNDRREHMLLEPLDTLGLKIFDIKDI